MSTRAELGDDGCDAVEADWKLELTVWKILAHVMFPFPYGWLLQAPVYDELLPLKYMYCCRVAHGQVVEADDCSSDM